MKADDDIVRGVGYVTIYAAYLEEKIDYLLSQLYQVGALDIKRTAWKVSDKIQIAKKVFAKSKDGLALEMIEILSACKDLFDRRNELIHGVIYSPDYHEKNLIALRPNVQPRRVDAEKVYSLANALDTLAVRIYKPLLISQLSNILRKE